MSVLERLAEMTDDLDELGTAPPLQQVDTPQSVDLGQRFGQHPISERRVAQRSEEGGQFLQNDAALIDLPVPR